MFAKTGQRPPVGSAERRDFDRAAMAKTQGLSPALFSSMMGAGGESASKMLAMHEKFHAIDLPGE
eukprot:CAMPEP_0172625342 /NCGR_PEP_ID=MMETSP1068-20121228/143216_1 /TAXON_ID=35684 /ORGANISM="Pseudopedinella elastica, Strain CCMP716" /LENGTH=64 /DNA_ID=CAMNT_0013434605 /DNA_START=1 /DNA_END=192 /DNA_ORIENTATION=-